MLHLIYGSKSDARMQQKESFLAKHTDAEIIVQTAENVTAALLEQIARGTSLFDEKLVLVLDGALENPIAEELILSRLDMLATSPNVFLVYERELPRETVKAFEKAGAVIALSEEIKKASKREFNVFAITDALQARDKKQAWLLYREAVIHETEPEAIHGAFFWSFKNMLLLSKSEGTAGLNPFVASKARAGLKKWKPEELAEYSRKLVHMVHAAHGGTLDFEEALEQFVLGI